MLHAEEICSGFLQYLDGVCTVIAELEEPSLPLLRYKTEDGKILACYSVFQVCRLLEL